MADYDVNGLPIIRFGIVRDGIRDILKRKLPDLADRIEVDRTWPTSIDTEPRLLVMSGTERKVIGTGPHGSPEYRCTGVLGVALRVQARTEALANARLDVLEQAVCQALLCQPDALVDIEGFEQASSVTRTPSLSKVEQSDRIEAQSMLAFDCIWTEAYPPFVPDTLTRIRLVLDAIDPADPIGPYPAIPPFAPPADPPRPRGPDGRAEAGIDFDLPQ